MEEEVITIDKYPEYIDSVIEISSYSNNENSITYDFEMSDDYVYNTITLYDGLDTSTLLKEGVFHKDSKLFKEFFTDLINRFIEVNDIVYNDVVSTSSDNKSTYRIGTSNNDQLTISGMNLEDTSYFSDLINNIKVIDKSHNKVINNTGSINVVNVLMVVVLLLVIVGCVLYLI